MSRVHGEISINRILIRHIDAMGMRVIWMRVQPIGDTVARACWMKRDELTATNLYVACGQKYLSKSRKPGISVQAEIGFRLDFSTGRQ